MTKPLRIFSAVWGSYLDWFEKGTVQSLRWPRNRQEIQSATWVILTKTEDIERVKDIIGPTGVNSVEIMEIPPEANPANAYNQSLLWSFIYEIERCLSKNASLIVAPPDIIFSEGCISNLRLIGSDPNICACVPHVRVLESFFEVMNEKPMEAPAMVTLSFNGTHLHDAWKYAEVGQDPSTSFVGGVSWKQIDNTRIVTHLLPAPFLCNFIPSDLSYFMKQEWFGAIDHEWPSKLCKQERMRCVGSSDGGFIVEITQKDRNIPQLLPANSHDPSGFLKEHFHNQVNRAMSFIFRGESC